MTELDSATVLQGQAGDELQVIPAQQCPTFKRSLLQGRVTAWCAAPDTLECQA